MSFFKALKFNLNRLLITLKIKRVRYRWYIASTEFNQGKAIFNISTINKKIGYRQWEENIQEERELNDLISTINEFLDVSENSDSYKTFVASEYKKQGYTVWEYSKDKKLNLVLKKAHDIILVQCKNDKIDISIKDIAHFETITDEFLKDNQIFEHYRVKIRYTISGMFLEEPAYVYIKEHSDSIEYDIIKMVKS